MSGKIPDTFSEHWIGFYGGSLQGFPWFLSWKISGFLEQFSLVNQSNDFRKHQNLSKKTEDWDPKSAGQRTFKPGHVGHLYHPLMFSLRLIGVSYGRFMDVASKLTQLSNMVGRSKWMIFASSKSAWISHWLCLPIYPGCVFFRGNIILNHQWWKVELC